MKDFVDLLNGETMDWNMNIAEFKRQLKARGNLIADN